MELKAMLEAAGADLPEGYRCVFVLREIEAMSVAETAEALEIGEATVKTRHWRARRLLRTALAPEFRGAIANSFDFAGVGCARLTEAVVERCCG